MTPASTPTAANESIPIRFRDRVRSRTGMAELFVFRVGDECFAFDVGAVEEVIESPTLYTVPGTGVAAAGVCQHEGRALHVAAAGALLGVEGAVPRVVLVLRRGQDHVGLLVDDVDDVCTLELGALHSPPHESDELLLAVHWNGQVLIAVLDARAVITAAVGALRGERP